MRISVSVLAIIIFLVSLARGDERDTKMQIFDEKVRPLLEQFRANPSEHGLRIIGRAVEELNAARRPRPEESYVKSIDPRWIPSQLRDLGAKAAAISLCGADLHSCAEARNYLMTMTAQCSRVFLGTINLARYPDVPKNLYDATDPKLILFVQTEGMSIPQRVGVQAVTNPDTVAIVLCPEESRVFGHALRSLRSPH